MKVATAAFAASTQVAPNPSLNEYKHFHGMLCKPSTAQKCVDSFDGTVLFMPHTYCKETLPSFDCTRPILTVWSYYLLVFISLTGLSSLFGRTRFRQAQELNALTSVLGKPVSSSFENDSLEAKPFVWEYVLKQSGSKELYLKRRFEYEFAVGGLTVMMLHLQCEQNKLYLVEVYRWKNPILKPIFHVTSRISHWVLRNLIRFSPVKARNN